MADIRFVTSNEHKFEEVRRMFEKRKINVSWVRVKYEEPRGETNREIALKSAQILIREGFVDPPFFVEDSGLFIRCLGGFPGPYSSYVFKKIGCKGILRLMNNETDRSAEFVSSIVFVTNSRRTFVIEGRVHGTISRSVRGGGWGFDPIFQPNGAGGLTFGELREHKDRFSHRGRAVGKLISIIESLSSEGNNF